MGEFFDMQEEGILNGMGEYTGGNNIGYVKVPKVHKPYYCGKWSSKDVRCHR